MNNMTGDPNQENRPSIFGFDTYPCPVAQPIDWSRIPIQPIPPPNQSLLPNLQQFNTNYQNNLLQHDPSGGGGGAPTFGNFSFCTTQTPHPAQFPFPTTQIVDATNNIANTHSHGFGYNPSAAAAAARCKRKTNSPPPSKPVKQHITEEKMAEHMSKLHISSETAGCSKETDTDRTRRLYMCEEMRKLQADSILPQSLLSRIQRPCTALVLWTPPRRLINLDTNNDTNDENSNNNEENLPDNNRLIVENDSSGMDFDNM